VSTLVSTVVLRNKSREQQRQKFVKNKCRRIHETGIHYNISFPVWHNLRDLPNRYR